MNILRKKTLALLLGSTALVSTISFDVVARVELEYIPVIERFSVQPSFSKGIPDALSVIDIEALKQSVMPSLSKKEPTTLESNEVEAETTADLMTRMASKPLVMVDADGTKHINPHFQEQKQTILKMNALSYAISKRQSASDAMNKWAAALNSNADEYAEFLEYMDGEHFGDCLDMFDILEEMDFQDRRAYIKREIEKLETYIIGQVAGEQRLADDIYGNGWELKAFEGMSGYRRALGDAGDSWVKDDRGFVAFNRKTNTITVIYHGSRDGSDWAANFDGMKIKASQAGLTLPGDVEVHRGFANLVASCKDNVAALVREFHAGIDDDKKSAAEIYVSGHSLGAALATLSTLELSFNLGAELFGSAFDNTVTNNFKGLFLSAPRALGASGKEAFDQFVGEDNVLRQNVHGDPVPLAAMKKVEGTLLDILTWIEGGRQPGTTGLAKIPLIGKWLESQLFATLQNNPQFKVFIERNLEEAVRIMSGYESVGHLALDDTSATLTRMLWPATKAFAGRTAENFVGMFKGYWGTLVGNGAENPGVTGFIKNTVWDLAATLVAPFHYGTTLAGEGGAFDHNLPDMDTDKLLKNGQSHLDTKASTVSNTAEKKSWWGSVKSGVSKTVGRVKNTVGSWFGR